MAAKPRILIVEDEMPVALMMTYLLSAIGCNVAVARTGEKGMEMALETKFDVIALAPDLPGLDGFQICSELKQRHFSRHTPVVFIADQPSDAVRQRAFALGAADFIEQPFEAEDFISRILTLTEETATA